MNSKDIQLGIIARRYHYKTEVYDRTICTGGMGRDGVLPANGRELGRINAYAHARRFEAISLGREIKCSQEEVETAIRRAARVPFEQLEQEFGLDVHASEF